jgi:hypothetical protein
MSGAAASETLVSVSKTNFSVQEVPFLDSLIQSFSSALVKSSETSKPFSSVPTDSMLLDVAILKASY